MRASQPSVRKPAAFCASTSTVHGCGAATGTANHAAAAAPARRKACCVERARAGVVTIERAQLTALAARRRVGPPGARRACVRTLHSRARARRAPERRMETLLPHAPAALRLAAATALALPAQRARTVAPVAPDALVLPLPAGQDGQEPELGVRAQLIESPNLARFLRRAKEFLERGDYPGGIAVLQDAIEGRVVRDASGR